MRHQRADAPLDDVAVELDAAVVEEPYEPVPVVQGVADVLGDGRLGRDAGELLLEPGFERQHERLAALLAHDASRVGAAASDGLLDRIEGGDPLKRLAGDRCGAALGDVVEAAPHMGPAEGERDRLLARSFGDGLVGRVPVALHDAAIAVEQSEGVHGAATGSVGVGDGRRIGSAPRPVVARHGPEVALLGAAASGIEHRRRGLVDRDLAGTKNDLAQPPPDRLEFGRRIAHPEGQHRTLDVDPLRQQHLGLPMERQVPGVFGDQHVGDQRLGRQPALDQPLGRRRLDHGIRAGPAGIFGPVRDDHPELRRNNVEPLRCLLADHVHGRTAARAVGVVRRDRHVEVRQMRGQRGAAAAPLLGALGGPRRVLLVRGGLAGGNRLLDVLEGQKQLLRIELLRAATELCALQLAQQMPQPIVLRQRLVARRDRRVALGARRREQGLQRLDVGRKLIGDVAHVRDSSRFGDSCGRSRAA